MTHLLINSEGNVKHVDLSYSGIDQLTETRLRCIDDWLDFLNTDEFKVFDLIEPSNLTLLYLAIEIGEHIYEYDNPHEIIIDKMELHKNILTVGASINPYLEFARQVIDKVNPASKSYAYGKNSAMVVKEDSYNDLFTRIQVMMEAVFFRYFHRNRSLEIFVSENFDIPYVLNMYATVTQWNSDQYKEYNRIVKEESEKAEKKSAKKSKTEESNQ